MFFIFYLLSAYIFYNLCLFYSTYCMRSFLINLHGTFVFYYLLPYLPNLLYSDDWVGGILYNYWDSLLARLNCYLYFSLFCILSAMPYRSANSWSSMQLPSVFQIKSLFGWVSCSLLFKSFAFAILMVSHLCLSLKLYIYFYNCLCLSSIA